MGITDENLVAQKVTIWEGMWVAKQGGDNIGVSILYSIPSRGCSEVFACWNGGLIVIKYDAGILLDAATNSHQ